MQFEFATPNQIIFGKGRIKEIRGYVSDEGSRILIVGGTSPDRFSQLSTILDDRKTTIIRFSVPHEPTVEIIRTGVNLCRMENCDLVIAIGGGSAIDAGKAIAVLSTNEGDITDFLEVIGQGKELRNPGLSMIAVPTTAGTGCEVTKNAVIAERTNKVKVSLRSKFLLPNIALIDPELTLSLPKEITASTGMDAFTQLIEPYVSQYSNPLTDAVCQEGLIHASKSLIQVYKDGHDIESRENMSLASLFSGIALANAKLGAVHGFAGVLGGMYAAPHGMICAALIAAVTKVNIDALRLRNADAEFIARYARIAQILNNDMSRSDRDLVGTLQNLTADLKIPKLSEFGVKKNDFPEIITKAADSSSMKGNPVVLSSDELNEILEMSY